MARTITCILLAAVIVTSSLLYAIPMPALAQGFVIIPHLDSDYKFKVVDHGAEDGFEQPDFDDSEFSVGSAGFGTRSGDCSFNNPIQARTPWPINTDILLRKEFVLPAATGNLQVRVTVDNDVQVFINGMDISGGLLSREGCAELDSFVFNATANAGLNLIAVRARDRGIVSYVDIEVVQLRTSPSLVSPFITAPLDVDGRVGFGEWEVGNRLNFPHGYISVRNDDVRLYLLVNVLEDKKIDPGEFFWLTFDVNRNSRIDPNVDINYRFIADTNEIGYQFYEGAGKWTELRSDTRSSVGTEYECFIADGTKETFLGITTDCSRHRVWEIGIDLPEIRARPGDFVQMGLRVHSDDPDFTDDLPAEFF